MALRCLRYRASNSASFAVLCSGPYHQHQTLPSAVNKDSCASDKASFVGALSRPFSRASAALPYASRASHNKSQAATSSWWPIHTSKFALIHEAGKLVQEFPPVSRVILPRVFAVQKNAHCQRLVALHIFADVAQPAVQVRCRHFAVHPAVDESHQI